MCVKWLILMTLMMKITKSCCMPLTTKEFAKFHKDNKYFIMNNSMWFVLRNPKPIL